METSAESFGTLGSWAASAATENARNIAGTAVVMRAVYYPRIHPIT
jgi:hypothetical protein